MSVGRDPSSPLCRAGRPPAAEPRRWARMPGCTGKASGPHPRSDRRVRGAPAGCETRVGSEPWGENGRTWDGGGTWNPGPEKTMFKWSDEFRNFLNTLGGAKNSQIWTSPNLRTCWGGCQPVGSSHTEPQEVRLEPYRVHRAIEL